MNVRLSFITVFLWVGLLFFAAHGERLCPLRRQPVLTITAPTANVRSGPGRIPSSARLGTAVPHHGPGGRQRTVAGGLQAGRPGSPPVSSASAGRRRAGRDAGLTLPAKSGARIAAGFRAHCSPWARRRTDVAPCWTSPRGRSAWPP
jgi:hypothetical protein